MLATEKSSRAANEITKEHAKPVRRSRIQSASRKNSGFLEAGGREVGPQELSDRRRSPGDLPCRLLVEEGREVRLHTLSPPLSGTVAKAAGTLSSVVRNQMQTGAAAETSLVICNKVKYSLTL